MTTNCAEGSEALDLIKELKYCRKLVGNTNPQSTQTNKAIVLYDDHGAAYR